MSKWSLEGQITLSLLGDNTAHLGHTVINIANPELKIHSGDVTTLLETQAPEAIYDGIIDLRAKMTRS